jgi:hypothetical protein
MRNFFEFCLASKQSSEIAGEWFSAFEEFDDVFGNARKLD